MVGSDVRPIRGVVARSLRITGPRRSFFTAVALLALSVAPLALAQTATKPAKKKGAKPAASASASAAPAPPPEPEPPPPPEAEPEAHAAAPALPTEPVDVSPNSDDTYTTENPNKRYYFVGVRYRGTIVPAFLEHLFVNDGGTIYSNSIGAEVDMRKGGQSMIGWIQYTEYGFGNTLFFQKGTADEPQNYSIVNSGLKGIYAGLDESWSVPVANHLDFEYGFGIGIGVIFGNLLNDWTYNVPNGSYAGSVQGSNGLYYAPCQAQTDATPCTTAAHQNASIAKVGNYVEKNWLQGGAVPVIFPHIAIPQFALRYKPIKEVETRLSLGFSLTGFWFGLSADYGLENVNKPEKAAPAEPPSDHPRTHRDNVDDTL
jgi:hypothetical protein